MSSDSQGTWHHIKKVIATTDKTVAFIDDSEALIHALIIPLISTEFIKTYVRYYNDGQPIVDAQVVIDSLADVEHTEDDEIIYHERLKLDGDNVIISFNTKLTKEDIVQMVFAGIRSADMDSNPDDKYREKMDMKFAQKIVDEYLKTYNKEIE